MERTELPIAVFDSGLGGISVLRALVQRLRGRTFSISATRPTPPTACARSRRSAA